jgi:hypothetical protein
LLPIFTNDLPMRSVAAGNGRCDAARCTMVEIGRRRS